MPQAIQPSGWGAAALGALFGLVGGWLIARACRSSTSPGDAVDGELVIPEVRPAERVIIDVESELEDADLIATEDEADDDRPPSRLALLVGWLEHTLLSFWSGLRRGRRSRSAFARDKFEGPRFSDHPGRLEPRLLDDSDWAETEAPEAMLSPEPLPVENTRRQISEPPPKLRPAQRSARKPRTAQPDRFEFPPLALLSEPKAAERKATISTAALEQNARLLEGVLDDFGVRGEIINVRPGPVVTLYELEPAPGIKSARVIGLADDIARSMSAIACRVAVIPGKNAIGIELPNARRETVYLRELLAAEDFEKSKARLGLCLGKTIGGEPVIADLARMPHLLVAGTTGSGKSVSINTMILSLLYRHTPHDCRMIMIDPKMLELSVYDGIPHLLTPVVTDPKQAVIALKWTVREMEDRYRKMSKLGVRNIDGYNARLDQARQKGEAPDPHGADRLRPAHRRGDLRAGRTILREDALHRRHHRRDGRPDDGRRQGHRGRRPAPRPDGPRRRHPRHHGDAAARRSTSSPARSRPTSRPASPSR